MPNTEFQTSAFNNACIKLGKFEEDVGITDSYDKIVERFIESEKSAENINSEVSLDINVNSVAEKINVLNNKISDAGRINKG